MDKAPDAFRIISEVAGDLDVPQHVLRFWESRFSQIKPMKRGGGRRYYRPDDVGLLRGIRHLLYSEGYTIRGVQRILREQGVGFVQAVWREGAPQPPRAAREDDEVASSRGLLGLLPGFRKAEEAGEDDDAPEEVYDDAVDDDGEDADAAEEEEAVHAGGRREPRFENAAPPAPARAVPPAPSLSREQTLQLQMALDGLGECRRLLDDALKGGGSDK